MWQEDALHPEDLQRIFFFFFCVSVSPGAQPFLEQIESSAEALQDYGISVVKVKGAQGSCWVGWSE